MRQSACEKKNWAEAQWRNLLWVGLVTHLFLGSICSYVRALTWRRYSKVQRGLFCDKAGRSQKKGNKGGGDLSRTRPCSNPKAHSHMLCDHDLEQTFTMNKGFRNYSGDGSRQWRSTHPHGCIRKVEVGAGMSTYVSSLLHFFSFLLFFLRWYLYWGWSLELQIE